MVPWFRPSDKSYVWSLWCKLRLHHKPVRLGVAGTIGRDLAVGTCDPAIDSMWCVCSPIARTTQAP